MILLLLPTVTNLVDKSEGRRQLMGFQEPQDFSLETGVGIKQVSRRNMHIIRLLVVRRVITHFLKNRSVGPSRQPYSVIRFYLLRRGWLQDCFTKPTTSCSNRAESPLPNGVLATRTSSSDIRLLEVSNCIACLSHCYGGSVASIWWDDEFLVVGTYFMNP